MQSGRNLGRFRANLSLNLRNYSITTTGAVGSFEKSLTFYQTTRSHIQKTVMSTVNAARTQISFNLTWFIPLVYTHISKANLAPVVRTSRRVQNYLQLSFPSDLAFGS